jgi:ABC-type glutathione transport system ATPase component
MLLDVKNWRVVFATDDGDVEAVRGVSFSVEQGKCLAVVGESGSGKSQLMQTLFGLAAKNARLSGYAFFDGTPLDATRSVLGRDVAFIFQDPLTSLTPHMTIGAQMVETLNAHSKINALDARTRCLDLLKTCRIDDPALRFTQYPHELSGGMRQRVMIAQAIAHRPKILIADEPTTALDVTVQAEVLDLLADLRADYNMALILITHDMGVAARMADDVMVMSAGRCVEQGTSAQIFSAPCEEYTKELLSVKKSAHPKNETHIGDTSTNFLTVRNIDVNYSIPGTWFKDNSKQVLHDISFVGQMGCGIAVVGESGSGKSTLARAIAGLLPIAAGSISVEGNSIKGITPHLIQTIFQDPLAALNPRQPVGLSVREALDILSPDLDISERTKRAHAVFDQVSLPQAYFDRYPHELSGGQCQRVCIARALLPQPKLLICDEAISALDATTAAHILRELVALKKSMGITILFITHDLQAAAEIADQVLVLQKGRIMEFGPAAQVFGNPQNHYTQNLLRSTLVADPAEMARRTKLRRAS